MKFKAVFDCCIRFYPHMKGIHLLFRKDTGRFSTTDRTPFGRVASNFERKKFMNIVEEIFGRYLSLTPIQTANALVVAASEEDIYLNCVYFLIRREPNILFSSKPFIIITSRRRRTRRTRKYRLAQVRISWTIRTIDLFRSIHHPFHYIQHSENTYRFVLVFADQ